MVERNILYCPVCSFELGEGSAIKNKCPDCGSSLRLWDVSDGTRPGKRNGVYDKAGCKKHDWQERDGHYICSGCQMPLASVDELTRVHHKWCWQGGLTPDEDKMLDLWFNITPTPVMANGFTKPENNMIESLAKKLGVSRTDAESTYREVCSKMTLIDVAKSMIKNDRGIRIPFRSEDT